jgi:hypothetical protein
MMFMNTSRLAMDAAMAIASERVVHDVAGRAGATGSAGGACATKIPSRAEVHNKNVGQDQWEKFFRLHLFPDALIAGKNSGSTRRSGREE